MKTLSFFKLQKDGHVLFWSGIEHSRDNKHPQFEELKSNWEKFLEEAQSPLVIIEDKVDKIYANEMQSIQNGGEIGFMTFLATKIAIPLKCFEPDRHQEINYLAGLFGKEKTEYYYFARAIAHWYRVVKDGRVEEYILPFIKRDKEASEWDEFDFSISHIKRIHKNIFGDELDFDNKDFFLKIENPFRDDNLLKDVVRASGAYRDKAVIEGVKSAWKNNDIFMVYGLGHKEAHKEGLNS